MNEQIIAFCIMTMCGSAIGYGIISGAFYEWGRKYRRYKIRKARADRVAGDIRKFEVYTVYRNRKG